MQEASRGLEEYEERKQTKEVVYYAVVSLQGWKKKIFIRERGKNVQRRTDKREREIYHSGGDGGEDPPVLIPNTEVKLTCADNTLRATAREDR